MNRGRIKSLSIAIISLLIVFVPFLSLGHTASDRPRHHNASANHRVPHRYLVDTPKAEKRKDLTEHLMLGIYTDFLSQYFSKEIPLSKGPVWQPSATIEAYGFGFNAWSNFVINAEANQGDFNEVDLTMYYNLSIGHLTIHPYVAVLIFPNSDPASLDYSAASVVETDFYIQYNVGEFDFFGRTRTRVKENAGATYAHIGVGYSHAFNNGISLETSSRLNMGNGRSLSSFYNSNIDANIDALAFVLAASWEVHNLIFKPNLNAAVHVIPEIRRAISQTPNLNTYNVWGGLSLAYNF